MFVNKEVKMKAFGWVVFCALAAVCAATGTLISFPCNDKTVEKLARLGLTYINEDRSAGYKFSLNRIANVHLHDQGPAGKVYYLDLDVLETKCHVRSPKSWKRCDIRPFRETQITGSCNTTVLYTSQGFSYLHSYDCTLSPDQPEKLLRICPDCPLLLPVDSREAQQSALMTLHKYNSQSTLPTHFRLQHITRASQNTPLQTFVEYTILETDCSLKDIDGGVCEPVDLEAVPAGFCAGGVYTRNTDTDVHVSCETFRPQVVETPVGIPDMKPAQHEKPANVPSPVDPLPKPSDPNRQVVVPKDPSHRAIDTHIILPVLGDPSSESLESDSDSSEELRSIIARRPPDFRYKEPRHRRQAAPNVTRQHIPIFQPVFPDTPSPFRSCPGASRYTTV